LSDSQLTKDDRSTQVSSNEQVEDDCETCGGTGEIFTLEREELPCPSCVSRELNQQIAELRAAHEPSVDVKQMNRDLCAKDGHVLGVTARPCLRCHEWFDPIYGTEQMRKDTLENASPETAPEIVEWKNVDTGETGTLCTLCGHEQNPNQSPSADIEALLESFVWAVRRDNDNGDQYTRQEVKDLRAELLAAIRAVQPPSADAARLRAYFDNANCISHPSLFYSSANPFTDWCEAIDWYVNERAAVTKNGEQV
jgi:hypothetical protein